MLYKNVNNKYIYNVYIMGNLISRNHDQMAIQELTNRLTALENIDQNRDGLVSKEEYDTWAKKQEANLDLFRQRILAVKQEEYQKELEKLQNEIQTLKTINQDLEDRLVKRVVEVKARGETNGKDKLFGEISKQYIDQEIDRILADKDKNSGFIPDYYEKKIYRNIFNMLFGLLESLTTSSEIKFLSHKITFQIEPDIKTTLSGSGSGLLSDVDSEMEEALE